jgi:hypothetical protein
VTRMIVACFCGAVYEGDRDCPDCGEPFPDRRRHGETQAEFEARMLDQQFELPAAWGGGGETRSHLGLRG